MDRSLSIEFQTTTADDEQQKQSFLEILKNTAFNITEKILVRIDYGQVTILDQAENKIRLNFNEDLDYRRILKSKNSELISRAVGAGKLGIHILDLTAGLGVDGISLVRLGYTVTSLERNPLVYMGLQAAYAKWTSDLKTNYRVVFADCAAIVRQLKSGIFLFPDQNLYQVAYFDPMFPQKKKSALPRQEMVLLQKLTFEDPDGIQIMTQLIQSGFFKRLVVKRPLNAETVLKPSSQLKGKLIRYDIYNQTSNTQPV